MNPIETNLLLPFTKKYGSLGAITFQLKPLDTWIIPANAVLLEGKTFKQFYWVDNGNNQGSVFGTLNDKHFLVMHILYNIPSPNLLIELGFKDLFDK